MHIAQAWGLGWQGRSQDRTWGGGWGWAWPGLLRRRLVLGHLFSVTLSHLHLHLHVTRGEMIIYISRLGKPRLMRAKDAFFSAPQNLSPGWLGDCANKLRRLGWGSCGQLL